MSSTSEAFAPILAQIEQWKNKVETFIVLELQEFDRKAFVERYLRIIVIQKVGGIPRISQFINKPLIAQDDSLLSNEVKMLIQEEKIKGSSVILNIDRRHLKLDISTREAPDVDTLTKTLDEEYASKFERSEEKLVRSQKILPGAKEGEWQCMVGIMRKRDLDRMIKIFKDAGQILARVVFSVESLASWLNIVVPDRKEDQLLLIHLDPNYFQMQMMFKQHPILSSEVILNPSPRLREGVITGQIAKCIGWLQKIGKGPIQKILVAGEPKLIEEKVAEISKTFGLPCEGVDYLKNVAFDGGDLTRKELGQESYAELIGAGFDSGSISIDFLPDDVKNFSRFWMMRYHYAIFIALVAFVLFGANHALANRVADKRVVLDHISAFTKKNTKKIVQMRSMREEIDELKSYFQDSESILDLMNAVYTIFPNSAWIEHLECDDKSIVISGKTSEVNQMSQFLKTLLESKYISEVEADVTSVTRVGNKKIASFEVHCLLTTEEETKIKVKKTKG